MIAAYSISGPLVSGLVTIIIVAFVLNIIKTWGAR